MSQFTVTLVVVTSWPRKPYPPRGASGLLGLMVATVNSGFALAGIMTGGGGGSGIFWASRALPGKAERANIDDSNLCIRQFPYKHCISSRSKSFLPNNHRRNRIVYMSKNERRALLISGLAVFACGLAFGQAAEN